MFRLVRSLIALVVIAAAVYLAVTVPLGRKTLWQHLKAIAGTQQSQDLVEGVKQKAGEVIDRHRPDHGSAKSKDQLTDADRKGLRKLLRDRMHQDATAKGPPR